MTHVLVTLALVILAFFAGAAFASYGRDRLEDDDFEDEEPTVERVA